MDYLSSNHLCVQLSVELTPMNVRQLQSVVDVWAAEGIVSKIVMRVAESTERRNRKSSHLPVGKSTVVKHTPDFRDVCLPFVGDE